MNKKVEASALTRWMNKGKGIKQPRDIAHAGNNIEQPEYPRVRRRKKSERTTRVEVRVTPEERQRIELYAVRESVSVSEVFSRMLALYEREHGRIEVRTKTDETST